MRAFFLAFALSGCSLLVPGSGGYIESRTDAGPDAGPPPLPDGGSCPGMLTLCNGACYDLTSDEAHCGRCEVACGTGEECRASACVDPVIDISCGQTHACALRGSGAVWCWGKNETGQLGTGDFADSPTPERVLDLGDASRISAAGFAFGGFPGLTCATQRSGQGMCWGANGAYQLGDGTTDNRNVPVRVAGLSGVLDLVSGYRSTCALLAGNPYLMCWGDLHARTAPQAISGAPPSASIDLAVSISHGCLVSSTGEVYCWGTNQYGQLGDGTTTDRANIARVVPGLNDIVEVVAAPFVSCARQSGGQVWCWGVAGGVGAGGSGMDAVTSPQPLPTLSNARQLGGGANASAVCAVRMDGSVWCWGMDLVESARTGSAVFASTPTEVSGAREASRVAVGGGFACIVRAQGDAQCWGVNDGGRLGDGTMMPRLQPTSVLLP